jgi:hypothetical protein
VEGLPGVCWLYLISNVFTLAKMLRDAHEADLAEARMQGRAKPPCRPMHRAITREPCHEAPLYCRPHAVLALVSGLACAQAQSN